MMYEEKRQKNGWINKAIMEKTKYLNDMQFYMEELVFSPRKDIHEMMYVQKEIERLELDIIKLKKLLKSSMQEKTRAPFVMTGDRYVDGIGLNPIIGDLSWGIKPTKLHKPIFGSLV